MLMSRCNTQSGSGYEINGWHCGDNDTRAGAGATAAAAAVAADDGGGAKHCGKHIPSALYTP